MSTVSILLFGIVVLITHFLEAITGFGCTALALPFCILIIGIKTAVPTLIILAWFLSLCIIIIDFKSIVWKQYLRILAFVGIGLPIGMIIFSRLPEGILKKILGAFMVLVAIRGLYISITGSNKLNLNKNILNFILFLGGIVHGAFGTGGPFVVIYAASALPKKSNFRATLCTLWFTLNTVIIAKYISSSVINPNILKLLLCVLPFLFVGMILGNKAHKIVNENLFIKLVYTILFISGIFMFL